VSAGVSGVCRWAEPPADATLAAVAAATDGFAGADLQALCTAAVLAAFSRQSPALLADLESRPMSDAKRAGQAAVQVAQGGPPMVAAVAQTLEADTLGPAPSDGAATAMPSAEAAGAEADGTEADGVGAGGAVTAQASGSRSPRSPTATGKTIGDVVVRSVGGGTPLASKPGQIACTSSTGGRHMCSGGMSVCAEDAAGWGAE
jgi:SpoVK/Ycf46/Vps4 family AAA+-type ATPase